MEHKPVAAVGVLRALTTWLVAQASHDPHNVFSPLVVYRSPMLERTRGEFFEWLSIVVPLEDVRILRLVEGPSDGALLFEAVDPVTMLRRRTAWFVSLKNGLVDEIEETAMQLPT